MSSLSFEPFWARDMLRFISFPSFYFCLNMSKLKMSFQLIRYSGVYLSMLSSSYCRPGVVNFWGNRISFLLTLEISSYSDEAL